MSQTHREAAGLLFRPDFKQKTSAVHGSLCKGPRASDLGRRALWRLPRPKRHLPRKSPPCWTPQINDAGGRATFLQSRINQWLIHDETHKQDHSSFHPAQPAVPSLASALMVICLRQRKKLVSLIRLGEDLLMTKANYVGGEKKKKISFCTNYFFIISDSFGCAMNARAMFHGRPPITNLHTCQGVTSNQRR